MDRQPTESIMGMNEYRCMDWIVKNRKHFIGFLTYTKEDWTNYRRMKYRIEESLSENREETD
jgi:hypothetical protein